MLIGAIAEELLLPTTVAPFLFDVDSFPSTAVIIFGTGGIAPAFYSDSDVVYSPSINLLGLAPQFVVTDADTIFAATSSLVDAIAPALFQSDDVIYSSTIVGRGILGPFLVVDVDRFFSPHGTFNFTSAVVASDDNISGPILQHGTTWRTLSASFVDADLFRRPDVSWPVVSAAGIDADVIYHPDLPYYLRPPAISDEAIFAADVGRQARPGFVTDTEQFFGPTIVPPIAPVTLPPGLVVDIDSLFAPTVLQPGILVAALYSDADVFLTPTITTGAVTVVPSLLTDTDTFAAPHIVGHNATFIQSEIAMMGLRTTYIFDLG